MLIAEDYVIGEFEDVLDDEQLRLLLTLSTAVVIAGNAGSCSFSVLTSACMPPTLCASLEPKDRFTLLLYRDQNYIGVRMSAHGTVIFNQIAKSDQKFPKEGGKGSVWAAKKLLEDAWRELTGDVKGTDQMQFVGWGIRQFPLCQSGWASISDREA